MEAGDLSDEYGEQIESRTNQPDPRDALGFSGVSSAYDTCEREDGIDISISVDEDQV